MIERTYTIKGVCPLIQHNEQLADPLNPFTRAIAEISKKRKKTEDDLLEMSKREWRGGLYYSEELGIHIPERCFERMLRDAASMSKMGKAVQSGLIVMDPSPLVYDGPKDLEKMWESGEFQIRASVKVGQARVIRTRPMFRNWGASFTVTYDEAMLDARDIDGFVEIAGRLKGLNDWRPKHGRFQLENVA